MHALPALAAALLFMGGQGGPGPGGGAEFCYLVAWVEGACVAAEIHGPPLSWPCSSYYQWVVYPTSRQRCIDDFVGNGKTGCNDQASEPFHPVRHWFNCVNGQIHEYTTTLHTEVTCRHAAYTESAEDCQQ